MIIYLESYFEIAYVGDLRLWLVNRWSLFKCVHVFNCPCIPDKVQLMFYHLGISRRLSLQIHHLSVKSSNHWQQTLYIFYIICLTTIHVETTIVSCKQWLNALVVN